MQHRTILGLMTAALVAFGLNGTTTSKEANRCTIELVVLGIAQDAGIPQMGNSEDRAWEDPTLRRLAASLGLVDRRSGARFMFEATPDMRQQLQYLDEYAPARGKPPGLNGIFLTHAHIGHYAGLMFVGHESMGATEIPVYVMPRMAKYLSSNGPWDQLVHFKNIALHPLKSGEATEIGNGLSVTPYLVPHRDEYSETVGFVIDTTQRSALFLPDIDSWDRWQSEYHLLIEDMIRRVDVAYIDASFYDNNEIPGRDMSDFPHPRITEMMKRFSVLTDIHRSKIRFIHLNHSNPARYSDSKAHGEIVKQGFRVAQERERVCLSGGP